MCGHGPIEQKKTPSSLDEDQLANERGMDVVKVKAKISKKAKKDEHFETSLYPESTALIIYQLREIYEKLICHDLSANF